MRIGLIIIILLVVICSRAQKVKGRYYKDGYPVNTFLKIKFGHHYKMVYKYDKDYLNGEPIGKMCRPPGAKKQKRIIVVTRGTWRMNADTLFLVVRHSRGSRSKNKKGATQKWLVYKDCIRAVHSDNVIRRRKPRLGL